MTRTEIIEMFRAENPEITDRVITDAVLYDWVVIGDKEICCKARCIVGSKSFSAVVGGDSYDVTDSNAAWYIENFYDVDEYPGGGVAYNDDRLKQVTIAQLDNETPSWRGNSNGTPKKYYRRLGTINFETPPDTANTIKIYTVLLPNDFNDAAKTPYNELKYLEPYHYAVVLYLGMRAKWKVGKREDAEKSQMEYERYIMWMKKQLGGGKWGPIRYGKITDSSYINRNR